MDLFTEDVCCFERETYTSLDCFNSVSCTIYILLTTDGKPVFLRSLWRFLAKIAKIRERSCELLIFNVLMIGTGSIPSKQRQRY